VAEGPVGQLNRAPHKVKSRSLVWCCLADEVPRGYSPIVAEPHWRRLNANRPLYRGGQADGHARTFSAPLSTLWPKNIHSMKRHLGSDSRA
jgi:hypothetical protein